MDSNEEKILKSLDEVLNDDSFAKIIRETTTTAISELNKSNQISITKNISLDLLKNKIPEQINLCRLFVLKANTKSKIERHRNSIQRTKTIQGAGEIRVFTHNEWTSHNFNSVQQWIVLKENTWHEPIAQGENWITITFHTAGENEIIDEYN